MNPFQPYNPHSEQLFAILSRINKKSSVTKAKALTQLYEELSTFDLDTYIPEVANTIGPLLSHNEYEIRNLAVKIYLELNKNFSTSNELKDYKFLLILAAVETSTDEKSKQILQNTDINECGTQILEEIGVNKNKILYFKTLIFLIKKNYNQRKIEEKIIKDKVNFDLNELIQLKFLNQIFANIKNNTNFKDMFLNDIKKIHAKYCIDLKWKILQEYYNFFDLEMFHNENFYTDDENILCILNKYDNLVNFNYDKIKIKNFKIFSFIFSRTKNLNILKKYVNENKGELLHFNLFIYCDDFDYLNTHCDYLKVNEILNYMNKNNFFGITYDRSKTLIHLDEKKKIIRCNILNLKYNCDVDFYEIEDIIDEALNVLPKSYFIHNKKCLIKTFEKVFTKYPDLISNETLNLVFKNKHLLVRYIPLLKYKHQKKKIVSLISKKYDYSDYIYLYNNNCIIPGYLNELLYFVLNDKTNLNIKKLNTKKMIGKYFHEKTIKKALMDNLIDFDDFILEIYKKIGKMKINNSVLHKSKFYFLNSYFYKDIHKIPIKNSKYNFLKTCLLILTDYCDVSRNVVNYIRNINTNSNDMYSAQVSTNNLFDTISKIRYLKKKNIAYEKSEINTYKDSGMIYKNKSNEYAKINISTFVKDTNSYLFLILLLKEILLIDFDFNVEIDVNDRLLKNIKTSHLYYSFKILYDFVIQNKISMTKFTDVYEIIRKENMNFVLEIVYPELIEEQQVSIFSNNKSKDNNLSYAKFNRKNRKSNKKSIIRSKKTKIENNSNNSMNENKSTKSNYNSNDVTNNYTKNNFYSNVIISDNKNVDIVNKKNQKEEKIYFRISTAENFQDLINAYFFIKNGDFTNEITLKKYLNIKNFKIINLIAENLLDINKGVMHNLDVHLGKSLSSQTGINNKIDQLSIKEYKNTTIFKIKKFKYISNDGLNNIFSFYKDVHNNYEDMIEFTKNDFVWKHNFFYEKNRIEIFNTFLNSSYCSIADSFVNNYNLTRFETNAIDKEIFELLVEGINFINLQKTKYKDFIWNVFLQSVKMIRNINITFFLENHIKDLSKEFFTENKSLYLQKLLSYNFPNLSSELCVIDEFLIEESKNKVDGINAKLSKTQNGFVLKAEYAFEDTKFELKIEMDNRNVQETNFITNLYKKDLLTVKVENLLKRCRKYMEILSIWKVNVDQKLQGSKECLICYYIVEISDNSFPDFKCKTCNNKFHKKCISKWVDKGKRNECPLCRKRIA
ncbi:hypothetical protein COBT_001877 [Conglomerata obtusa]